MEARAEVIAPLDSGQLHTTAALAQGKALQVAVIYEVF
jgi:hypothetical protein